MKISINGTDETCPLGDYEFTFALPEGCTDVTAGFRFADDGTELAFTAKDNLYTAKVSASDLESGTMTIYASAKLKDGFVITGEKEVTVLENHVGGTATCTEKQSANSVIKNTATLTRQITQANLFGNLTAKNTRKI